MIDTEGYRAGVGMILFNRKRKIFWAKRIGQDAWQFPQGGMNEGETPEETMYRELKEEVGLNPEDVRIITVTHGWLRYDLPKNFIRYNSHPLCVGQKQKWFLLRLVGEEDKVNFLDTEHPEFDGWRWVDYWDPMDEVINFKRGIYLKVLKIFAPYVLRRGKFRSYSKKSEPDFTKYS